MDTVTPELRSKIMARVRAKDTGPEMTVRRMVHGMGYRYRLHRQTLPGKPDLAFPARRKAIFVHGCFWHRHKGCGLATMPASRTDYWGPKFQRTVERDGLALKNLGELGWSALVIWECELKNPMEVENKIREFLR